MNRTTRGIMIGLAFMLFLGLGANAATDMQRTIGSDPETPSARPFKLRAAGQIDLGTGAVEFGGVATHLGLYSAGGFLNPADFSILGTIKAANGDTLNFVAFFTIGPLGEIQAAFEIDGGTGRFAAASGSASGPVALDPEFMFVITADGNLEF